MQKVNRAGAVHLL